MKNQEQLQKQYDKVAGKRDWHEALAILDRMLEQQPPNPAELYYKRAMVFLELAQSQQALDSLQQVLVHVPQHPKAREMIALIKSGHSCADDNTAIVVSEEEVTMANAQTLAATDRETLARPDEPMFGRYQIIEEVGRGGMGQVYKAHDTVLERTVALKMLLGGDKANAAESQRFLREARANAQLHHPNIIAIHDIGYQDCYFFTMDFIAGPSLKDFLKQKTVSLRQIVEIMIPIAEAVQFAHSQGIIHRDIKPANILLDDNLQPKILDFGLAKIISADEQLTIAGTPMGTPPYMSPEQAGGDQIDRRTDIYALGATLYEALTGKPLFTGDSFGKIFKQILNEEPLPPRKIRTDIPSDLEAICLKCLHKDPEQRYPSAEMLVQDLRNFHQGRPVCAGSTTALARVSKFVRRYGIYTAAIFGLLWCAHELVDKASSYMQQPPATPQTSIKQKLQASAGLDFLGAPLADIADFMSTLFKVRIVIDPNIHRKMQQVDLTMYGTLAEILGFLCRRYHLQYQCQNGAIFISASAEEQRAKFVPIKFVITYDVPATETTWTAQFVAAAGTKYIFRSSDRTIEPGKYTATLSQPGYYSVRKLFFVGSQTAKFKAQLIAAPRQISFATTDPETGKFVSATQILLDGQIINYDSTLKPGIRRELVIFFANYQTYRRSITIAPGEGPFVIKAQLKRK